MPTETDSAGTPLIRFDSIVKRFGGVTAGRGRHLEVRAGEISLCSARTAPANRL